MEKREIPLTGLTKRQRKMLVLLLEAEKDPNQMFNYIEVGRQNGMTDAVTRDLIWQLAGYDLLAGIFDNDLTMLSLYGRGVAWQLQDDKRDAQKAMVWKVLKGIWGLLITAGVLKSQFVEHKVEQLEDRFVKHSTTLPTTKP